MNQIRLGFKGGNPVTLVQLQNQVCPGWSQIIERLVADLFDLGWNGVVIQAKEKFGALRFYIEESIPALNDRINQASRESYKTCAKCGKSGVARDNDGWIVVLCDEHAAPLLQNLTLTS